jgi:DNA-binding XRE family transcriptional regulator
MAHKGRTRAPTKPKPKPAPKGVGGRKPFAPTPESRKMVNTLASFGVPQEDIASVVGVDKKTLRKYFREDLDNAMVKANAMVAQSLYNKAIGSGPQSFTAAIFWAKTRMGWKEPAQDHHVDGSITLKFDAIDAKV